MWCLKIFDVNLYCLINMLYVYIYRFLIVSIGWIINFNIVLNIKYSLK